MTNHEISCLKQGERNERFWTFGPGLVQDMLNRGDLQRQITPPPPLRPLPTSPLELRGNSWRKSVERAKLSSNGVKICDNI